jgi:hypothetical protein
MRVMREVAPGSSKGRTTGFGPVNGGSNPPPGTTTIMRTPFLFIAVLLIGSSVACHKADETGGAQDANDASSQGLDCDHDLRSSAVAEHSWPYPADHQDLRWTGGYQKTRLKLKPTHAAFVTATISFREGDLIQVLDSQMHIIKPRLLIAKRDIVVKRKVINQGIEVERDHLVAKAGEPAGFLFYNSRGHCMVATDDGPSWTPCTFEDTFEGLNAENPNACEQNWWIQMQRSKVDKGWMIVNPKVVERIGPAPDEAK